MDEIETVLSEFVYRELMQAHDGLAPGALHPLVQSGVVDSLGIFQLVAFLEERFGAELSPEDIVVEHFETVRSIAELVRLRVAASEPAAGR